MPLFSFQGLQRSKRDTLEEEGKVGVSATAKPVRLNAVLYRDAPSPRLRGSQGTTELIDNDDPETEVWLKEAIRLAGQMAKRRSSAVTVRNSYSIFSQGRNATLDLSSGQPGSAGKQLEDAQYSAEKKLRKEKRWGCLGFATIGSRSSSALGKLRDTRNVAVESRPSRYQGTSSNSSDPDSNEPVSDIDSHYAYAQDYDPDVSEAEVLDAASAQRRPRLRASLLPFEDSEEEQEIFHAERASLGQARKISVRQPLHPFAVRTRELQTGGGNLPLVYANILPGPKKHSEMPRALRKQRARSQLLREAGMEITPDAELDIRLELEPTKWPEKDLEDQENRLKADSESESESEPEPEPKPKLISYSSETGQACVAELRHYLGLPDTMKPLQLVIYLLQREKLCNAVGCASPHLREMESDMEWKGLWDEIKDEFTVRQQQRGEMWQNEDYSNVWNFLKSGQPLFGTGNWKRRASQKRKRPDTLLSEVLCSNDTVDECTESPEAVTNVRSRLSVDDRMRRKQTPEFLGGPYWDWVFTQKEQRPRWRPVTPLASVSLPESDEGVSESEDNEFPDAVEDLESVFALSDDSDADEEDEEDIIQVSIPLPDSDEHDSDGEDDVDSDMSNYAESLEAGEDWESTSSVSDLSEDLSSNEDDEN